MCGIVGVILYGNIAGPGASTAYQPVEESGSIPNTGGDSSCQFDSSQPVDVYIENLSNLTLDYYWMDSNCEEQYAGTLNGGDSTTLSTYVTYDWLFFDTDTGNLYFEYVADGGDYVSIPGDSASNEVNGFTVSRISYDGGYFEQVDDSSWHETSYADGADFYFVENGRDEWSVYLYDQSRDVYVHLDLYTGEILYDDNTGQGEVVLYNIEDAQ